MIMKGLLVGIILCHQCMSAKITPKRYEVDSTQYGYAVPTPLVVEDPKQKEYVAPFLAIWDDIYSKQDMAKYKPVDSPDYALKTVIAVTAMKLDYIVPKGSPNPFFDTRNEDLTHNFISDSVSMQPINFEDAKIKTPEGITIKTFNGKNLVFKKDPTTNKYTVNGVEIMMHNLIPGEPNVIIINDFLFNYYHDIKKTYKADMYKRIAKVPYAITMPDTEVDITQFVGVWEKRREQIMPMYRNEDIEPKTIVTATPYKFMKLLPQGSMNPLAYKGFEQLTDNFIADSVSTDTIDFNDPKLKTPEGVMIMTMSGKYLTFKKDPTTYKYTVNGNEVDTHKTFSDGTNVILINGFLFNQYEDVKNAMYEMQATAGEPVTPVKEEYKLPSIPEDLKTEDMYTKYVADLLALWKHRIFKTGDKVDTAPKSVLTANMNKWRMVLPEGTTNPLTYPGYEKMADYFIKDSLSPQSINFNDPKLLTPEGITIKTTSGKELVFKTDPTTKTTTVNGVKVEKEMLLTAGTNIIIVDDFLFNQYMYIKNALEEMNRNIPDIPTVLTDPNSGIDTSGIVNLWENRLTRIKKTPATRNAEIKPKTIVATTPYKWMNMVPADAANPLYMTGYEKITDDFILDSMSADAFDYSDPKLMTPEGLTLKSISGKDLVFMKYPDTGKLTVNGIPVQEKKFFDDKTTVFTINDFLFNNYMYIKNAIDSYLNIPKNA
jgi:hypothetical protein